MKNLLNKWLGGEATWDEEKNLRRAATQDDFLQEAVEGYDTFPNSNHAATVDRLKARLPKKKQDKGLFVSLPRVAAAAAIIGLIGTLFWVQQQVAEPAILSQHSPQVSSAESIEETESTSKLSLETPVNEIITEVEPAPKSNPTEKEILKEKTTTPPLKKKKSTPKPVLTPEPTPAPVADVQADYATVEMDVEAISATPEPIMEDAGVIVMEADAVEEVVAEEVTPVEMAQDANLQNTSVSASRAPAAVEAVKRKSRATTKMEAPVAKINYYVGQVQNEDGQPLNGVKIIGLNTSFNAMSEMNGDFTLKTDRPLTKIAVSKDGFHTRKIAINQYSDFLNVSLVKQSTKIPGSEEMLTLAPKPVEGFVPFFNYLAKNMVYPKAAKERGIEGEVEVRFFINETGTPTNIKVSNPDIYGFDKEAIRLLENGPKWQPVNSHARYYVPFEKE